jgi:hypothetical protein
MTAVGDHVVPTLLRAFRDAHPELDISLHIGNAPRSSRGCSTNRPTMHLVLLAPPSFMTVHARDDPYQAHGSIQSRHARGSSSHVE